MRTLNVAGAMLLAVSMASCLQSTSDKARDVSVVVTDEQARVERPTPVILITSNDVAALQTVHTAEDVTQEFFDVPGSLALPVDLSEEEGPVDRWRCTEQHHPISTARKPPTPPRKLTAHSSGGKGLTCDCPPGDPFSCYDA